MRALVFLVVALTACGSSTTSPSVPVDASDEDVSGPEDTGVPLDLGRDTAVAPEAPSVGLPYRAPCERDDQCASGLCVRSAGITQGCGLGCRHDEDCYPLGGSFGCAIDRAPSGGRFVCAEVAGATRLEGEPCATDRQCMSNLCLESVCRGACVAQEECTAGERCGALTVSGAEVRACRAEPVRGVTLDDFVLYDGETSVDSATEARRVVVPADTVSLTLTARDLEGRELYAAVTSLRAPDRTLLIDGRSWNGITEQPVREYLFIRQLNSALVPSNETLRVQPGVYEAAFALLNDRAAGTRVTTRGLRATVRLKRAPGGTLASGTLSLRVYTVGLRGGPTAATLPRNARWTSMLTELGRIYAQVGLRVEVTDYRDLGAEDAARFALIDSREELEALFATSEPGGEVLNLFLVRGISAGAGLENAIGVAGDINGPAGTHGTTHSGVVVGWETTLGGRDVLPQTVAHECGHYLGLWHTRERLAGCTSASQTNCSPFGGADPIADTPSDGTSSRYLMHWQTDGTNSLLTRGEGVVLRAHALVR